MRFIGVDVGTGSSKGVVVDASGAVLATAVRPHETASPQPGWFEHDADGVWWSDTAAMLRELLERSPGPIGAVSVSGIGPAVLLTDSADEPLRPAILYGIDTRSEREVAIQNADLGADALLAIAGNLLTTQAVGPKLAWIATHEPETWSRARRLYSAPGWVVRHLTGEYTLDHYSASASDPLYDLNGHRWWERGWAGLEQIERPQLAWPGEVVGLVTPEASKESGLASGTPVVAGTIDALAEAYSVGCKDVGDTMVMYGSTMFLIQTVAQPIVDTGLWAAVGRTAQTYSSAAGMSTSGLLTSWFAGLTGTDFATLTDDARQVPAGSEGLLLLPYFAGERTPIFDPRARGAWIGLTLRHGRGHLYRSILESVALGVRHNLDTMARAGAKPRRLVAVGGGTREALWTQIVSDATGLPQDVPSITLGASYGDARLAADATGVDTSKWNPIARRVAPDTSTRQVYDLLYQESLAAYPALMPTMHTLSELNR